MNTEEKAVSSPTEPVVSLRSMSTAPRDGTEILAYHKSGGNFHPVKWRSHARKECDVSMWGMRWNDEYSQRDGNYVGWIPFPIAKAN